MINKTLRDLRKKVEYPNQQIELSPLSQLISSFGSISVVLSSSVISQTAAGNRDNLNKPISSSKQPDFQNEAMFMVTNDHFRVRGSVLALVLNRLRVCCQWPNKLSLFFEVSCRTKHSLQTACESYRQEIEQQCDH